MKKILPHSPLLVPWTDVIWGRFLIRSPLRLHKSEEGIRRPTVTQRPTEEMNISAVRSEEMFTGAGAEGDKAADLSPMSPAGALMPSGV